MLDSHIRPLIDPPLNKVAYHLSKKGVTANMVTAIGFAIGLLSFIALAIQAYEVAIFFIILSRLMDGLDGPIARQTQATDLGGYLDIVSDFVFYAGAVFFFAVGQPHVSLAATFLIFSFFGSACSFLAYAIIAAKHEINHEKQGKKSFYYLSGITEGTETIMTLILICLFPDHFVWIASIYGILCWLTAIGRTLQAMRDFAPQL